MEHLVRRVRVAIPEDLDRTRLPILIQVHHGVVILSVEIRSSSVEQTWRWVQGILQDRDFILDLLPQLEERPFVLHHRDVTSTKPFPEGEEDLGKTHVTTSCLQLDELMIEEII